VRIALNIVFRLAFLITYSMFFLIYEVVPNKGLRFKSVLKAALFASLLWEVAKHSFRVGVANIATYSIFYGSLSSLAVFVLWVYYSSVILVVGGEFLYILEEDRQHLTERPKEGNRTS